MTNPVHLERCRACGPNICYALPDGGTVTIILGVPPSDTKYKAISHVWGNVVETAMVCNHCAATSLVRLKSTDTFQHIMALAGAGNSIWLDNMSINQDDPHDVATQVAVMGDIYSRAESVSVLLPDTDRAAYETLAKIVEAAKMIVREKWKFEYISEQHDYELKHADGSWQNGPSEENIKDISPAAKGFFRDFHQLVEDLENYSYWQRAWTFQEWSLAQQTEIALDGSISNASKSSQIPKLERVKSHIVYAAILMADYKLRRADYSTIDSGLSRGDAPRELGSIKRLFPLENSYTSFDEVNEKELFYQLAFPNEVTNEILGLRPTPRVRREDTQQLRVRLRVMLDAFAAFGVNRKAKHEADLVACWSTMCNIPYEYSKDDTLGCALTKVIRKLRELGIKIYNFHAHEDALAEIDLRFFQYAAAHPQTNSTAGADLLGAPIFTGRADTLTHFLIAVTPPQALKPRVMPHECSAVAVRYVEHAVVMGARALQDSQGIFDALQLATSGEPDEHMFTDSSLQVVAMLEKLPKELLVERQLVSVAILTSNGKYLYAWAVCPASIFADALLVAREELNGTLVLVARCKHGEDDSSAPIILAFLNVSDHRCGTFLIPTDAAGHIEITFKTPQRADIVYGENQNDRCLCVDISLSEEIHAPSPHTLREIQGSLLAQSNKYLVKEIGKPREKMAVHLREIFTRMEGNFKKPEFLNIDIGHPELEAEAKTSGQRLRVGVRGVPEVIGRLPPFTISKFHHFQHLYQSHNQKTQKS